MDRIAVLTSGGDAPGMNACIRAVVRTALNYKMDIYGIERGYAGLIKGEIKRLESRSVSNMIHKGGTFLNTARCDEFKDIEVQRQAVEALAAYGIEGLVVIGGDGTLRGAKDLSDNFGIKVMGIPGTIDNDLAYTDYTVGFDTAVNTVLWAINNLRDTLHSHDRVGLLEVMGRNCGDIALHTGIAVGASVILVPEVECSFETIITKINAGQRSGKKHFIIVVAEGVGGVEELAKRIQEATGIETRASILGHVQRGGNPTTRDRVCASAMGAAAVKLLTQGIGNRVIALRDNKIVDFDIYEALQMKKEFERDLLETALEIGI